MTKHGFSGIPKYWKVLGIAALCGPSALMADVFIGNGMEGKPGSWAAEAWPAYSHTTPSTNDASMFLNPAYFTETGVTGTHRDQFEFWAGGSVGYTKAAVGSGDPSLGFSSPQVGIEYYYNVVEPKVKPGEPGYHTFWTSPTLSLTFPNGNTNSSGYGAGANQYSLGFCVDNYVQFGKVGITFNPAELYYAFRNQNATDLGPGVSKRFRGGMSLVLMDVAGGYQVTDTLYAGLHHSYSLYNEASSDFQESKEGKIGPAFSYSGWYAKHGILLSTNLNFDYYTSPGMKRSTSLAVMFAKYF